MISDRERQRFAETAKSLSSAQSVGGGIGTYKEKTMHRVLKYFFEPDEEYHEIPLGAYVADICRDNRIIEIQTSGFNAIRDRLDFFLRSNEVTVVYPILGKKRLVWIDPESGVGEAPVASPKKGRAVHILPELGRLGELFSNDALTVKCVIVEATEYKLRDGWGNGGKRGAHRLDRVPSALIDVVDVKDAEDARSLLPFCDGDSFTAKEFAKACGFSHKSTRDISMALRFLESSGIAERVGKNKNTIVYRIVKRCDPPSPKKRST